MMIIERNCLRVEEKKKKELFEMAFEGEGLNEFKNLGCCAT